VSSAEVQDEPPQKHICPLIPQLIPLCLWSLWRESILFEQITSLTRNTRPFRYWPCPRPFSDSLGGCWHTPRSSFDISRISDYPDQQLLARIGEYFISFTNGDFDGINGLEADDFRITDICGLGIYQVQELSSQHLILVKWWLTVYVYIWELSVKLDRNQFNRNNIRKSSFTLFLLVARLDLAKVGENKGCKNSGLFKSKV
jgi:hypothetical protein